MVKTNAQLDWKFVLKYIINHLRILHEKFVYISSSYYGDIAKL
jgi:hypothetical protein